MPITIAVVNQKGGTAKTVTAANLAVAMSEQGRRVLAVDVDPQASLTFYFGHDERKLETAQRTLYWGLIGTTRIADIVIPGAPALIPSSIALAKADAELLSEPGATWILKEQLATVADDYDIVLLDCPPTLTLLTVNALAAADKVLIPVKTDLLSTLGVSQLLETVQKVRRRANPRLDVLGILPTLHNPRFGHDVDVLDELRATFGQRIRLFAPIRRMTSFDRAAGTGTPTVRLEPQSPGACAYRELSQEILEILDATAVRV